VNKEFDPAEAEDVAKRLLSHKSKETCICIMYREINNKNTAQITTLGSSNHIDALPTTWTWKKTAKLSHQALHLT
jgi:hypothetical protein